MSKILLFSRTDLSSSQKIALAKITSKPISDIGKSIDLGHEIIEYTLFMNDYPEVAKKLTDIMNVIQEDKMLVFEVDDDLRFDNLEEISKYEIPYSTLSNILDSAKDYE